MIVLALDTAGVDCAAAVYDSRSGSVMGEVTETIGKGHAERLIAVIDQALEKAGLDLKSIERIAVTIGPGSFTGIRVGVAAARGFSLSLGIAAVGISTLEVLAASALENVPGRPVLAAMDAKRGEIYMQRFDTAGRSIEEPFAALLDNAAEIASTFDGEITGSAAAFLRKKPAAIEPDHFPIATVARLGALASPDAGKPKPLYLRGPDAKPQTGFAVARV